MPRPKVRVSSHAEVRIEGRLGVARSMRHEIAVRLQTVLRLGAQVGPELSVYVGLPDGYTAVCRPSAMGGWVVATILDPGMGYGAVGGVSRVGGMASEQRGEVGQ